MTTPDVTISFADRDLYLDPHPLLHHRTRA